MKHIVLIKLKDRTLENQQAVAAILKKMTTKTIPYADSFFVRSEERRVGKECGS